MRPVFLFLLLCTALHAQVRINAGGPAYTDSLGQAWQSDNYFTGGSTSTGPIPAGAAGYYATKRYGDFSYNIPLDNGAYTVTLYLIENAVTAPGARVFGMWLNSVPVLSGYDLAADAGPNVPVRRSFPVFVTDGSLRMRFSTSVRSAFVNAIEIATAPSAPQALSGLAAALPPSCPAGPLTFYSSTDTNELWWCQAPGAWQKISPVALTGGALVVSATNTQAIVAYPGAQACRVEASESPTYQPLVHDVDPALFPGADQLSAGSGQLVLGKRRTDTGSDGVNYSRALQANTKHYVRLTCGTKITTAQFTTQTIPAGMTFNDGPQLDLDHPGQWKMPTRLEDRGQTIVDPQTGALLHAVSIKEEGGYPTFNGIFLGYGGFTRPCESRLVGPPGGPLGFVCTFLRYGQGGGTAYWIVPSTGETRFLGSVPISGGGAFGTIGSDLRTHGLDNSGHTSVWVDYAGGFAPSKELPVTGWNTYATVDIGQMMHDFDNTFDPTHYFCPQNTFAEAGQYTLMACGTGQDLPGWLGVLYGGDGRGISAGCVDGDACPRIVAAADIYHLPATQYCTLHNVQQMDDVASINVQLDQSGAPRCAAMGHMVYWRFLTDPHAQAMVVDQYFDGGGHWDHGPAGRVSEDGGGWAAVIGAPPAAHLNEPITRILSDSPFFAGARGLSWGSTTSKHPSYHQVAGVAPDTETNWLLDMLPFDGGQFYSPAEGATPISGQLYKYNPSIEQPSAKLARKQLPTLAVSGGRALLDISGPGSVIGDTAADSFRYCVALLANECRQGAAPGDTFVNAPAVWKLQCAGADGPVPDLFDLCIGNLGAYHQGMVQVDVTGARRARVITYGLAGIRNSFFYSTAKSLPDGSWALWSWGVVKQGFGDLTNVWMAKLPPLVDDQVDRSTFFRMPVSLSNPPAGTVTAAVEFGYAENGDPSQHFCSSRRETCVAVGPSFSDVNPYTYTSEGITGMPCAGSCTVMVPVVPGRIVYYRAVFYDQAGSVAGRGLEGVRAPLK